MSEQLFDVVFFGILQTGKDKELVTQNMASLFKTDTSKLAPYFAGGRKVIKASLKKQVAEKYQAALENIGLVIKLEPSAIESGKTEDAQDTASSDSEQIDTTGITVAPVGVDLIEHPVETAAQKIDELSDLTMAEAGTDVIENPVTATPQKIDDISSITMAETGSDVLEHPTTVTAQKIDDIPGISLAETGADIIANPKAKEPVAVPDTSELSLDKNTE